MRSGLFFFLCLVGAVSSAQVPVVPALEFVLLHPQLQFKDIRSQGKRRNITLSGDPKTIAKNTQETVLVQGLRWDGDEIHIGGVVATLAVGELNSEKSVKVPLLNHTETVTLAHFKNLKVEIRSRRGLVLTLPEHIPLQPMLEGNMVRFAPSDSRLQSHLENQVEELLSMSRFDSHFEMKLSGELPDMARRLLEKVIEKEKSRLLAESRKALKSALVGNELADLILRGTAVFPKEFPADLKQERWLLSRQTLDQAVNPGSPKVRTLWRLYPEAADPLAAYPGAGAEVATNRLGVVITPELLEAALRENLAVQTRGQAQKHTLWMGEGESVLLSTALGVRARGRVGLVVEGERAPRVRAWSLGQAEGGRRHFLDTLATLRDEEEALFTVGLTLEFPQAGPPRLVALTPLDEGGSAPLYSGSTGWAQLEATLRGALLNGLVNAKLDEAHGKWMSAADGLTPLRVRTLGQDGLRNPDTDLDSHWATALAIDYQVQAPSSGG